MVDVHDREGHFHPVHAEHLELHRGHGAGGVLYEDLVDPERQSGTGLQLAGDEVGAEQLASQVLRQGSILVHRIESEAAARLYERGLVLVRPDGHVAWRADEPPADPLAIIDTIRGADWRAAGRRVPPGRRLAVSGE